MRFVMLYHSLVSDWNHGNAHFLRGVARELLRRGHDVVVHEPADGWSRANLCADHGTEPLASVRARLPGAGRRGATVRRRRFAGSRRRARRARTW